MSKVFADAIESLNEDGTVTIGTSTNTVTATGNIVQANTIKDSGGNTLWTSDGAGNLSSLNTALAGNLRLLSTQTASGASSVSFTSGIDSTYDVYIFKFIDVNPATDAQSFSFQCGTGSGYGLTVTSTFFQAEHNENGTGAGLSYQTSLDLAQSTSYQKLTQTIGNGADECCAGELFLFNPASTTYVKHFYSTFSSTHYNDRMVNDFTGGYFNLTTAITQIDFKFASGNFDGTIKMYGLL